MIGTDIKMLSNNRAGERNIILNYARFIPHRRVEVILCIEYKFFFTKSDIDGDNE